jgi:hypothetical protein
MEGDFYTWQQALKYIGILRYFYFVSVLIPDSSFFATWALPYGPRLSAYTARALAAGPVSAAILNAGTWVFIGIFTIVFGISGLSKPKRGF